MLKYILKMHSNNNLRRTQITTYILKYSFTLFLLTCFYCPEQFCPRSNTRFVSTFNLRFLTFRRTEIEY